MILCQTKPQTGLVSKIFFFFEKRIFVESQHFFFLRLHYEEESYDQKPETDEMNEVETAPIPEEKHDWVQPRVTRPKKTSAVNYMSELALSLPWATPERGRFSLGEMEEGSWWVTRSPSPQTAGAGRRAAHKSTTLRYFFSKVIFLSHFKNEIYRSCA